MWPSSSISTRPLNGPVLAAINAAGYDEGANRPELAPLRAGVGQALAGREGGHHMDRGFAAPLVRGTAQCLAVDGDHVTGQQIRDAADPSEERRFEGLRIEGGKDADALDLVIERMQDFGDRVAPRGHSGCGFDQKAGPQA